MKKYLLLIILFLSATAAISAAPKPRFFITTTAQGDSSGKMAEGYLAYFETQVFDLIKEIYPCAEQNSLSSVKVFLDLERKKQLLGTGDDNTLMNIAQSMGSDYLISLKVSVLNNTALITAFCMDSRKANVLARAEASARHGGQALNAVVKVSKQLFDGLKHYEICPFKGPINIRIISTKKDSKTEQYPVYCNGIDGYFHKTTSIDNYSENNWAIQKNSKYASTGTLEFNHSEELKIEEENACYECSPSKQGPRTYSEKTTTHAMLQGLSNESESYGVRVDDARTEITFFEDGTYAIRVKAASTKGEKKTIKEVHAQGYCDNININPGPVINKIDEGINEIFGKFTGNAQDKTLSQKDTIKRINPATEEEETITYEFNLARD